MLSTPQKTSPPHDRGARDEPSPTLGRWRLVRRLGAGQSSEVFQAAPLDANQTTADYAVKRLKPACYHDAQAIAQIQHEAFVAGRVQHPHLVSILSAHVERQPYYVVMPYHGGGSLRETLNSWRSLPLAQALWIARQTAEALQALHEQGWLHSDVKPENVLIASNGHTTLCDLGLARGLDGSPRPGMTGTPSYLAPEAFVGELPLTPAVDSYALGIVLFEMLTGRLPFPHTDPEELAAAHRLATPPDPRAGRPDVPGSVARLLRQLLAKEPLRRPTGLDLIRALVDLEIDSFDMRLPA